MFTPEIREVPWKQGIHVSNIFWLVPNLFEVEDKVDWFQSTIQTIFTQRFYPLNRNRGKRQSQSRCTQWVERFFRFFIFKYHPCTQHKSCGKALCLFSLIPNHIDASMQKCLDLKCLLTTASERYDKKTNAYYSIGKISPKTNIAKK